jgi:hypothetical protein
LLPKQKLFFKTVSSKIVRSIAMNDSKIYSMELIIFIGLQASYDFFIKNILETAQQDAAI